jgi:uncharacterized coiled-coil DUF342 family protein
MLTPQSGKWFATQVLSSASGNQFTADRLRKLLSKLQARYQQVRDEEQTTAWMAEYDAMRPERDALAEELRKLYPSAVAKVVDLFARISANDEALSALHQGSASWHKAGPEKWCIARRSQIACVLVRA